MSFKVATRTSWTWPGTCPTMTASPARPVSRRTLGSAFNRRWQRPCWNTSAVDSHIDDCAVVPRGSTALPPGCRFHYWNRAPVVDRVPSSLHRRQYMNHRFVSSTVSIRLESTDKFFFNSKQKKRSDLIQQNVGMVITPTPSAFAAAPLSTRFCKKNAIVTTSLEDVPMLA